MNATFNGSFAALSRQMSAVWTLKALGLGAVGLTLSVAVLGWFFRRFGSKGFLKEVIFFPTEFACVEHVFEPTL